MQASGSHHERASVTGTERDGPGVQRAARIMLRPIANPLPLGLLALSGGTLLLSGLELRWLAPAERPSVALIVMAFVFPLQFMAAVFGFLGRDVAAATAMGVLSGVWLSLGLVTYQSPEVATIHALGLLLLLAGVAMLVPAVCGATGKLLLATILGLTATRFAISGVFEMTGSDGWRIAAGVVGLVLCVAAIYGALALALEDTLRRTVLPVMRLGSGLESIEGDLAQQLERIEDEAGVREQL